MNRRGFFGAIASVASNSITERGNQLAGTAPCHEDRRCESCPRSSRSLVGGRRTPTARYQHQRALGRPSVDPLNGRRNAWSAVSLIGSLPGAETVRLTSDSLLRAGAT